MNKKTKSSLKDNIFKSYQFLVKITFKATVADMRYFAILRRKIASNNFFG